MKLARGYIASGSINGSRTPQHIQNQIIRNFCEAKGFHFVLSRAEYWIDKNVSCQLWAAVKEEYEVIIFYSLWQLPRDHEERARIITTALNKKKEFYFACENESIRNVEESKAIEEIFLASITINSIEDGNSQMDFEILSREEQDLHINDGMVL